MPCGLCENFVRIVSLLPSATDIVVALGAANELVGVSHSCSGAWDAVPRLTSTWIDVEASSAEIDTQVTNATRPLYELDIDTLERLSPDVIVSQSLCDVCAVPFGDVIDAVSSLSGSPQLVDLKPNTLREVPSCFIDVGAAIARNDEAANLVAQWHQLYAQYHHKFIDTDLRVAFLDWIDPPFIAGHWIPDMLTWLGVEGLFGNAGKPSYAISWEDISQASPDLVIAACCGYELPRTMQEVKNLDLPLVCLDGYELFNRPSPALMPSLERLSATIEAHLNDV